MMRGKDFLVEKQDIFWYTFIMRLKEDQIDLEFVSDLKFTEFCVMALHYLKNLLAISDDIFFKIEISVREIINNAILHGNQRDLDKLVRVRFRWSKSFLRIYVKDENPEKVDFEKINNKIENNDILSCSGRGLLIVKNYMDLLEFNPSARGTEVVIEKHLC